MKKVFAWVLTMALVLFAAGACAETEETIFETLAGLEWSFSSGVGGWSTDMRIEADGSFSGDFHDSEMGESADEYPYGTVYCCSFTGRMALMEQVDEYAWKIRIEELRKDESQPAEDIDDGIRFVAAEPYGLSEGDEMILYRPGTPVSVLSEDMLLWAHVMDQENPPAELETWFLSSEQNDSGFVAFEAMDGLAIANPWEDMTAEQLAQASGLFFGVPEGAQNVIYRYLASAGLAEMQFTWENGEFCARIQPAALGENELMDISGMYFDWDQEEPVTIGNCNGTIAQAQDGGEWAQRCLWYDAAQGLMYSLSVTANDIDGLDLTALAEQIYISNN